MTHTAFGFIAAAGGRVVRVLLFSSLRPTSSPTDGPIEEFAGDDPTRGLLQGKIAWRSTSKLRPEGSLRTSCHVILRAALV